MIRTSRITLKPLGDMEIYRALHRRKRLALAIVGVLSVLALGAVRFAGPSYPADDAASAARTDPPRVWLLADLSQRALHIYEGDELVSSYTIAVGSPDYPTPPGQYRIRKIVWNPRWVPPDREWARKYRPMSPGDPANPMRVVKIYFREPAYYIHGTNAPGSLGTAASHGCLRMDPSEAADVARYLMAHGGQPRSESWFSRVLHSYRNETVVYLDNPIPFTVRR